MQGKGKRVVKAIVVGFVIFVGLAIIGHKNQPPRSNTSSRTSAAALKFMEFRKQIVGRSFDETSFFEQFGHPAKIVPTLEIPADVPADNMFREMYHPAGLVGVLYKCKDENAIVQYRKEKGRIEVIAVIKAADFMAAPPSLWKHTHYE